MSTSEPDIVEKSGEDRKQRKKRKLMRINDEAQNPCLKEHNLSMKCLSDNIYNKDACSAFFLNYKTCRKFWDKIMSDRRWKGIYPVLPPVEEREDIKKHFSKAT